MKKTKGKVIKMREIKFKGKINIHSGFVDRFGQWCIGLPEIKTDIAPPWNVKMSPIGESCLFSFPVDPETICECIGAYDKNGKDVYEHDLLDSGEDMYEVMKGTSGEWLLCSCYKTGMPISIGPDVTSQMTVIGNKYDTYEPPLYGKNGTDPKEARKAVNEVYRGVPYVVYEEKENDASYEDMER